MAYRPDGLLVNIVFHEFAQCGWEHHDAAHFFDFPERFIVREVADAGVVVTGNPYFEFALFLSASTSSSIATALASPSRGFPAEMLSIMAILPFSCAA